MGLDCPEKRFAVWLLGSLSADPAPALFLPIAVVTPWDECVLDPGGPPPGYVSRQLLRRSCWQI